MTGASRTKVTVVQPEEGDSVALPGFGAVFKLYSRNNGGEVAIVEHPFEVGAITAPHRHTREDEQASPAPEPDPPTKQAQRSRRAPSRPRGRPANHAPEHG